MSDDEVEFLNMTLHAEMVRRWNASRSMGWSDADIETGVWFMLSGILAKRPGLMPYALELVRMLRTDATAS